MASCEYYIELLSAGLDGQLTQEQERELADHLGDPLAIHRRLDLSPKADAPVLIGNLDRILRERRADRFRNAVCLFLISTKSERDARRRHCD